MPSSDDMPLLIEWDGAADATDYVIHGHVYGDALIGPIRTWETKQTQAQIEVPVHVLYEISVFSRKGDIVSINAEKAMIYAMRWAR